MPTPSDADILLAASLAQIRANYAELHPRAPARGFQRTWLALKDHGWIAITVAEDGSAEVAETPAGGLGPAALEATARPAPETDIEKDATMAR